MPWVSKVFGWKALAYRALRGPYHQVVNAVTAPPHAAAASSSQPAFTSSQRVREMPCVQALARVPASASPATSGAPHKKPSSAGTRLLRRTKSRPSGLPRERVCASLAQVAVAAQDARPE